MTYKVDFQAVAWETLIAGVRQKVFREGGRQLRLVEYAKEMQSHWCEKGHIGYLLEGILEIRFDSDVHVFHAGDGIYIPAGKDHRHMARPVSDLVRAVFVEDL
jgi:quercetin dioxygenase-like cupin family protein